MIQHLHLLAVITGLFAALSGCLVGVRSQVLVCFLMAAFGGMLGAWFFLLPLRGADGAKKRRRGRVRPVWLLLLMAAGIIVRIAAMVRAWPLCCLVLCIF